MINVLVASGLDPSGMAGLTADCATITSLGGHICPIVTASTIQNQHTLTRVIPTPTSWLHASCQKALSEKIHAAKCGLLLNDALFSILPKNIPWVVDPVLRQNRK